MIWKNVFAAAERSSVASSQRRIFDRMMLCAQGRRSWASALDERVSRGTEIVTRKFAQALLVTWWPLRFDPDNFVAVDVSDASGLLKLQGESLPPQNCS